jgi:hypothetical protein
VRLILAFLVAPIAPALAFALIAMLAGGPLAGLALAAYALMLNATVAHPIALVVGVPAYRVFQARRWVGLRSYAAGGLTIGAAVGALGGMASLGGFDGAVSSDATGAAVTFVGAALCGVLIGVTFWLIARPGRG